MLVCNVAPKEGRVLAGVSDLWENKTAVHREGLVRGKVSRKSQQVAKAREQEWLTLEYPPGREEELAGGRNASRQITLEIQEARLRTRQPEKEGLASNQLGQQGTL